MLDPALLRTQPDLIHDAIRRKNLSVDLDAVLSADEAWRTLTAEVDELRAARNEAAKSRDIERGKEIGAKLKELEPRLAEVETQRTDLLMRLPNPPLPEVPVGPDDSGNVALRTVGVPRTFDFPMRDHIELGEITGILDFDRARSVSGARFVLLKHEAVWMEFALVQLALRTLGGKGFVPTIPPTLVRTPAMAGTGFFPGNEEEIFRLPEDDFWLVGTSEVALVAQHAGETLPADGARYVGFSSCYRREAGSHGKDTRGMLRVHQFDKVEMVAFCQPEDSARVHEEIRLAEEELLQKLGIPYQVIDICTGDTGLSAARKWDLEGWIPSQDKYRELTSCSNCTDFQTRRLGIRIETPDGGKALAHSLNGTAFAIGRTMIAIMENNQRADGSIEIPTVLHPFMPEGMTVIPARNAKK